MQTNTPVQRMALRPTLCFPDLGVPWHRVLRSRVCTFISGYRSRLQAESLATAFRNTDVCQHCDYVADQRERQLRTNLRTGPWLSRRTYSIRGVWYW